MPSPWSLGPEKINQNSHLLLWYKSYELFITSCHNAWGEGNIVGLHVKTCLFGIAVCGFPDTGEGEEILNDESAVFKLTKFTGYKNVRSLQVMA